MEAIGINVPALIAQIINFSLLVLLLYTFLYRPILKMLDSRSEKIRESMEKAEFIRQEAERTQQEFQAQIEAARKEGQTIVGQATQIGERMREDAKVTARQEAEAIVNKARSEIQMERDQAIAEIRQQFADLTILAASKVINKSLDKETHEKLIEEVLAESAKLRTN